MARPIRAPRMSRAMQDAMQRRLRPDEREATTILPVPMTDEEQSALMQVCARSGYRETDIVRAGLAYMLGLYGLADTDPARQDVPMPDALVYGPAVDALRNAPSIRYLKSRPMTTFSPEVTVNNEYNALLRAHAARHYIKTEGRGLKNSGGIVQLVGAALDILFDYLGLPASRPGLAPPQRMKVLRAYTGQIWRASDMYRLALHLYMLKHDVSAPSPNLTKTTT